MTTPPTPADRSQDPAARAAPLLPAPRYLSSLTVPNRVESARTAVAFFVDGAQALNIPAASSTLFEVAIAEAVANAVKHGQSGAENAMLTCEIEHDDRQLVLRVIDGGPGFTVPEPRLPRIDTDHVETLPEAGYGLPIIHRAFPIVRAVRVNGRFGLELGLPLFPG